MGGYLGGVGEWFRIGRGVGGMRGLGGNESPSSWVPDIIKVCLKLYSYIFWLGIKYDR